VLSSLPLLAVQPRVRPSGRARAPANLPGQPRLDRAPGQPLLADAAAITVGSSCPLRPGRAAQVFTALGLISGAFFVLSMANTLFAVDKLGLSSAAGIWCGTASVVSFVFAVKVGRPSALAQHCLA